MNETAGDLTLLYLEGFSRYNTARFINPKTRAEVGAIAFLPNGIFGKAFYYFPS